MTDKTKRIIIVLDNDKKHHSNEMYYFAIKNNIYLQYTYPKTPWLNIIEKVFRAIKQMAKAFIDPNPEPFLNYMYEYRIYQVIPKVTKASIAKGFIEASVELL